jgi:hypothetical protein
LLLRRLDQFAAFANPRAERCDAAAETATTLSLVGFTSGERNSALGHDHYLCQARPADRDG